MDYGNVDHRAGYTLAACDISGRVISSLYVCLAHSRRHVLMLSVVNSIHQSATSVCMTVLESSWLCNWRTLRDSAAWHWILWILCSELKHLLPSDRSWCYKNVLDYLLRLRCQHQTHTNCCHRSPRWYDGVMH